MTSVRRWSGRPSRPTLAGSAAALALCVATVPATANGPTVTIEPAGELAGPQAITVTGSGFDPAAANGQGVYLVFGPVTEAPAYHTDPSIYAVAVWVHPGAPDGAGQAPMGDDGSFTASLDVQAQVTTMAGQAVDCTIEACAVITFGAHGSPDRSQDTCTSLVFTSTEGSPSASGAPVSAPAASPTSAPASSAASTEPEPSIATASAAPGASVSPMSSDAPASDACARMLGSAAP